MESTDLHRFLVELFYTTRRLLLEAAVGLGATTLLLFLVAPDILAALRLYLDQRLVFFGVMEPVVSLLKLSFFTALLLLAPWLIYRLFWTIRGMLNLTKGFAAAAALISILLFYSGVAFCLLFTLPFAVRFLLSYQSENLRAVISMAKFVDFSALFMLGFGVIFQLPLTMTVLARTGLLDPELFAKHRRYAVLIIAIAAALLTPTPDVFNMSLMGVPLYLLYESGIVLARIAHPAREKREKG